MPTMRRSGELVQTVLQVLREHPDGLAARDAIAEVEKRVELTDEEKGVLADRPGCQEVRQDRPFCHDQARQGRLDSEREGSLVGY